MLGWIFLVAIGLFGGILSGLLGIGGGVIIVPSLFFFFHFMKGPPEKLMHLVIGTSLASMIISTFVASYFQIKAKNVDWKFIKSLIVGILAGASSGVYIAHFLSSDILTRFFSFFIFFLSIYYFLSYEPRFRMQRKGWLFPFGLLIGELSSIMGIGGGVVTLPILNAYKIPLKKAVGTAAIATFITSFIGSVCYLFIGFYHNFSYEDSLGYIYIPAFFLIGISTAVTVKLGVKLSQKFSNKLMKKAFAVVLFFTSIFMFFKTF
jgi:uncharacterized membrane protein YfcA